MVVMVVVVADTHTHGRTLRRRCSCSLVGFWTRPSPRGMTYFTYTTRTRPSTPNEGWWVVGSTRSSLPIDWQGLRHLLFFLFVLLTKAQRCQRNTRKERARTQTHTQDYAYCDTENAQTRAHTHTQ